MPLLFAAAFCFTVSVRADDNAAQAAARAALMQKMQELDSAETNNSAVTTPAPDNQAPAAATPATENPMPATPSENQTAPAETPSATATPPAPAATEPAITPQNVAPAPEMTPSANVAPQMQSAAPPVASPTNENSVEAEEQAIVSQRQAAQSSQPAPTPTLAANTNALPVMNEMAPPPPSSLTATPAPQRKRGFFSHILHPFGRQSRPAVIEVQRQPEAQAAAGKNNFGFTPIEPPPLPVTPEQEAQLQDLLQKYEADQITPDEYQTERAAIIGTR